MKEKNKLTDELLERFEDVKQELDFSRGKQQPGRRSERKDAGKGIHVAVRLVVVVAVNLGVVDVAVAVCRRHRHR